MRKTLGISSTALTPLSGGAGVAQATEAPVRVTICPACGYPSAGLCAACSRISVLAPFDGAAYPPWDTHLDQIAQNVHAARQDATV